MDILIPRNFFLRVRDKFVAEFIDKDRAVPAAPTLVYKKLFAQSYDTGMCKLPQQHLALECKLSVRALQHALRQLAALGYIHIDPTPGECSTYVLCFSQHVRQLLASFAYDLMDDPDWYSRSGQACSPAGEHTPDPCSAEDVPLSENGTSPASAARGGYANSAHPSYKVYKSKNTPHTPLSPLPVDAQTRCARQHSTGRGGFSPFASRTAAQEAFAKLWAVWPVQRDQLRARRVFCSLARAGRLPSVEILLECVRHMLAHDDKWRRGYAPYLSNWLWGRRWDEAAVSRGHAGAHLPSSLAQDSSAFDSREERPAWADTDVTPKPALLPDLAQETTQALENLCQSWPGATLRPVLAYFRTLLATRQELPDMGSLGAQARTYLQEARSPQSLLNWLRSGLRYEAGGCVA